MRVIKEDEADICQYDEEEMYNLILQYQNNGVYGERIYLSNKAYERWATGKIIILMYKEGGVFPAKTSVEK